MSKLGAHSRFWRHWPYPFGVVKLEIHEIMIFQGWIQTIQNWYWFRLIPIDILFNRIIGICSPMYRYEYIDLSPMGRKMLSANHVANWKKTSHFFWPILNLVDAQWCPLTFPNVKIGCSQLVLETLTLPYGAVKLQINQIMTFYGWIQTIQNWYWFRLIPIDITFD